MVKRGKGTGRLLHRHTYRLREKTMCKFESLINAWKICTSRKFGKKISLKTLKGHPLTIEQRFDIFSLLSPYILCAKQVYLPYCTTWLSFVNNEQNNIIYSTVLINKLQKVTITSSQQFFFGRAEFVGRFRVFFSNFFE